MLLASSQSEKLSEASDVLRHRVCVGISELRGDNDNLHSAGCCRLVGGVMANKTQVEITTGFGALGETKCMKKLCHKHMNHYTL